MSLLGAAPAYPKIRHPWIVLGITVLLTVLSTIYWYHLRLHFTRPELMPVFMVGVSVAFFLLVRFVGGVRWRAISRDGWIVAVSSLLFFSLLWWFGRVGFFERNVAEHLPSTALSPLYSFFYFSGSCFVARTILPLAVIVLWLRRRPAEFGYRLRGGSRFVWVYVALSLVVMIAIWVYASKQPVFQAKYPMSRSMIVDNAIPLWQFLVYQLAYGLIFVSGESFWRGYMAFGLERDFGYLGLVFMVIPYTMAHFGKPLIETLGAIVTGLVLGYLALRHRSFWLGVAAHWSVALCMDVSAIIRRGIVLF